MNLNPFFIFITIFQVLRELLRDKCPNCVKSVRIQSFILVCFFPHSGYYRVIEYGELQSKSSQSLQKREKKDQKKTPNPDTFHAVNMGSLRYLTVKETKSKLAFWTLHGCNNSNLKKIGLPFKVLTGFKFARVFYYNHKQ